MTRATRHQIVVSAVLALATLGLFWPVVGYDFVNYDDPDYVTANAHVLGGLTWDSVVWAFQLGQGDYWHPLTWLSLMLDVTMFGRGAAGLHLTNLLLHTINSVLVFVLLGQWTGALWRSGLVAALFAVHPLRVESVAWITERKDVLSTLFWLLTLWAYAHYVRQVTSDEWRVTRKETAVSVPAPSRVTRHASHFYGLALVFFALGLMSKAMVVTAPLVMLLLDWWPLGRLKLSTSNVERSTFNVQPSTLWRLVREKLPFFVLSGVSCVVTLWGQRRAEAVGTLTQFPLMGRLEDVFVVYARYLVKTFWPFSLAVHYPHPGHWSWVEVAGSVVLVAGLSVTSVWLGRRRPYVLVGWCWFLGTLVPVIGLVRAGDQFMADRFTYVPLLGVFLILGWGAGEAFVRWRSSCAGGKVIRVVTGLVLLACALRTRDQLRHWRDSESLFRHALAVANNNSSAANYLGNALLQGGQVDKAITEYERALEIQPGFSDAHGGLGLALFQKGRVNEAITQFQWALRIQPDFAQVHNNLGNALLRNGRVDEAIAHLEKAVALQPNFAMTHGSLADALLQKGRLDEAMAHYQRALEIEPDNAQTHYNLGNALLQRGRADEAAVHYRRALEISPGLAEAHYNLGTILVKTGHAEEALAQFQKALEIHPDSIEVCNNLALLLATSPKESVRNAARAIELAQRAARLSGGQDPEIIGTLAAAYAEAGRFAEAITTVQQAIQLATVQTNAALVNAFRGHLKLYRAGLPLRDTAPTVTPASAGLGARDP